MRTTHSSPPFAARSARRRGSSKHDQWQVQIQAQVQARARVLIKTGGVSDSEIRAAHFNPIDGVGAAVGRALSAVGPQATLCVLPQGPQTIPYLARKESIT